jgi:acyl-CoA thioesterase-2
MTMYADTVAGVIDLEEIERNIFRGNNAASAETRQALYGGQVAAQALMAAGRTVPADRYPHSLHGYFLRPGLVDRQVLLRVDIDRDGGSFSARHVTAIQDGAVIFSMVASFHRGEVVTTFDAIPTSEVPAPEECSSSRVDLLVDIREVTRTELVDDRMLFTDCLWLRTAAPLPDDPLSQACGLTYLSDFGSGFGRTSPEVGTGGPSLDHAVWFQEFGRADEWQLLQMWPRKATQIRGLYEGSMRDQSGRLCAAIAQENLLTHK